MKREREKKKKKKKNFIPSKVTREMPMSSSLNVSVRNDEETS